MITRRRFRSFSLKKRFKRERMRRESGQLGREIVAERPQPTNRSGAIAEHLQAGLERACGFEGRAQLVLTLSAFELWIWCLARVHSTGCRPYAHGCASA